MYDPEIQRKQMKGQTELFVGLLTIRYFLIGCLLLWGEPDLLGATAHFIHELPNVLMEAAK